MSSTNSSLNWIDAGTNASVDALVLRYAAVLDGSFQHIGAVGDCWLLVDLSGRVVDCGASADVPLLGAPVTRLAGGVAVSDLESAWSQILMGRSQTVWPWRGETTKAATRSIELHPLRDVLSDVRPVIGALIVLVDSEARVATFEGTVELTDALRSENDVSGRSQSRLGHPETRGSSPSRRTRLCRVRCR